MDLASPQTHQTGHRQPPVSNRQSRLHRILCHAFQRSWHQGVELSKIYTWGVRYIALQCSRPTSFVTSIVVEHLIRVILFASGNRNQPNYNTNNFHFQIIPPFPTFVKPLIVLTCKCRCHQHRQPHYTIHVLRCTLQTHLTTQPELASKQRAGN
jgi:hypothetical protein